jgi:hypothetical protein
MNVPDLIFENLVSGFCFQKYLNSSIRFRPGTLFNDAGPESFRATATYACGILTFVEELSLEEDLAVSDGDDIGGNVGRHVTSLHTQLFRTGLIQQNWTHYASGYFVILLISVPDPHHLDADPDQLITQMRSRILPSNLMRIRIHNSALYAPKFIPRVYSL